MKKNAPQLNRPTAPSSQQVFVHLKDWIRRCQSLLLMPFPPDESPGWMNDHMCVLNEQSDLLDARTR